MAYSLIKEIGHGGMGAVYLGRDESTGQRVAVKMMSNQVTCYPEYRALFNQEVEALQRMDHPSVVHIVGQPYQDTKGNLYLPMEFIEGTTLEHLIAEKGTLDTEEAINLMRKILVAVQYIHNRRCIHRDIKPSNIMLRPDGTVCIIDFGIAKDSKIGATGHTVGTIIGTDGYMSPEQANGLNIDHRTDIYSLGCVLYYMLTGRNAVNTGPNDYQTRINIINSVLSLSASVPGIPPLLEAAFQKAVDKDMTKRFQTAEDFARALAKATGKAVPEVTVGRGSDNDIVINDPNVSRHHLTIRGLSLPMTGGKADTVLEINDTSTNGTGIDGRLLRNAATRISISRSHGTEQLPTVLLAGLPRLALEWKDVMDLLTKRGFANGTDEEVRGDDEVKVTGEPVVNDDTEVITSKGLNFAFVILSFLIPIVGVIIALVFRKDERKAKSASKAALIGFFVWFAINKISSVL